MVVLIQNTTISCQKLIIDFKKTPFFRRKLVKVAPKYLVIITLPLLPVALTKQMSLKRKKSLVFFLPSHGRLFLSKKCFDCQHIKWPGQHDFLVTSHFLDVLTKKKFA
jgi:hypothetical protein